MTDDFAFVTAQTQSDWENWLGRNVRLSEEGVTLARTPALDRTDLDVSAVDFDLQPNGNLSVLSGSGSVDVYDRNDHVLMPLSLDDDGADGLSDPTVVATTREEIHVVGRSGRIKAFSRRFRRLEWTATLAADPTLGVASERRTYLLDTTDGAGHCVRTIESGGRSEVVLDEPVSPRDLSVDEAETLYVLDERDGEVVLLRSSSDIGVYHDVETVRPDLPAAFEPELVCAQTPETLVFYGRDDGPRLVRYDQPNDEATELPALDVEAAGMVSGTTGTAGDDRTVFVRTDEGAVRALTETYENKKDMENTRYEGGIVGQFDGGVMGMQWHRATLTIDQIASDTRVDVRYYATDDPSDADVAEISEIDDPQLTELRAVGVDTLWDLVEFTPTELGRVLPTTPREELADWLDQARAAVRSRFQERPDVSEERDPDDMLFEDTEGRYLHLEIKLVGSRTSSPRLKTLKAYCPRKSYLRYLPSIYRNENLSSAFLEDFLSIFESTFVDVEEKLQGATKHLDPRETSADYLSWLNSWLAVDIGDDWPESARRELLARAPELYKMRGTKRGLMEMIDLYLSHVEMPEQSVERSLVRTERRMESLVEDGYLSASEATEEIAAHDRRCPTVPADEVFFFEHNDMKWVTREQRQKYYTRLIGHPYRFQVLLQSSMPDQHVDAIRRILESEKPVYTDVTIKQLRNRFRLEGNTYLGINTSLPKQRFEIGNATLGNQTMIEPGRGTNGVRPQQQ